MYPPSHILAVPRPEGTYVIDNGNKNERRYQVLFKGRTVGHIIGHKFISNGRLEQGFEDSQEKKKPESKESQKCIAFWVTDKQKEKIQKYADEHGTSVTQLAREAFAMRLGIDMTIERQRAASKKCRPAPRNHEVGKDREDIPDADDR